jgi:hypothetical protein
VIDVGINAPLLRFNRHLKGGAHTWEASFSGWQLPLTLAALNGDAAAEKKCLEQIRFSLIPDKCLTTSGGYPAQHELHLAAMYAMFKLDPVFWNQELTAEERGQIELLMKAAVIASAYTTADASYTGEERVTGLDGGTNLSRGWNPNFREGMFGMLIAGTVYFGGTEEVNKILDSYDHESFVAELKAANLMNTHETFTWSETHPDAGAPNGQKITDHIRNYRYLEKPLMDPMDLYYALTMHTYGGTVNCGLKGGKGILYQNVACGKIVSGCEELPNKGKQGMLLEFDSQDAGGKRSSMGYAYNGFRPNLVNHALVLVGGYWKNGPQEDEIIRKMSVGITDLDYKLSKGYLDYSKGKGTSKPMTLESSGLSWSLKTLFPWWENQLLPYHQLRIGTF